MTILFITPYLPNENAGEAGCQTMWRVITGLADHFRIHVITYIRQDENISLLEAQGIHVTPVDFPRYYGTFSWNTIRIMLQRIPSIIRSILFRHPYIVEKYTSRRFQRAIQQVLKHEDIDIIQCEYNVMANNLIANTPVPTVVVEHDVSIKPYTRLASKAPSLFVRIISAYQLHLWKRYEPAMCNRFNKIITVTEDDKSLLQDLGVTNSIIVIAPPVSVKNVLEVRKSLGVCFVGAFNRQPNQEALKEIIKIWPEIKAQVPTATLKIAGKHLSARFIHDLGELEDAEYAGFVDDIDTFIASSSVMLAPIRFGGGLKMKITHALACGTPVVTTSIGAEGIDLGTEEGLFKEDSSESIIQSVVEVLESHDMEVLSKKTRMAVQAKFSLEPVLETYMEIYEGLLGE